MDKLCQHLGVRGTIKSHIIFRARNLLVIESG